MKLKKKCKSKGLFSSKEIIKITKYKTTDLIKKTKKLNQMKWNSMHREISITDNRIRESFRTNFIRTIRELVVQQYLA